VHAVREAAAGRRCLSPPLSDRAIEVYQLMHKLDLHTQAELIRFALRRGIVSMDD